MARILILLALSVAIAVFTIIKTKDSRLPESTKVLLYIIAVLFPIGGLILYYVLDRKK
jgi:uncharacterized membrane protein (UPF0182 family)